MKKICIITNIPAPYRVDLFYSLQQKYKEYEFNILYSSVNEDNRNWDSGVEKLSNVHYLDSKTIKIKGKIDAKYIHVPSNVNKVLEEINPEIVIASEYNITCIKACRWCKKNKRKYISWSDGTLFSERNINIIQKYSRKYVCKNSNAFIASSTNTKKAQIHYGAKEENVFVSLLTIDVDKYRYERKEFIGNRLLFVGRLVKLKGLDLLLEALAKVNCDYKFTIVGDGDAKEELIQQVKKLKIQDKVDFVGEKKGDEVVEYYKNSDIFILPTRQDCYGLVLLEAACATMTVISSKYADGVPDIIEENVSGIIVDPYNEEDMVTKINYALKNREYSFKLAQNAYKNVNKFEFDKVMLGFKKAIEYVLS